MRNELASCRSGAKAKRRQPLVVGNTVTLEDPLIRAEEGIGGGVVVQIHHPSPPCRAEPRSQQCWMPPEETH
jgi:hypothetical protein